MEKNVLTKQYLEENQKSIKTFTVKANLSEKDYTTIYNIYKLHGFIYIALPHLRGDAVKIVELTRDNIENTLMFVYRDGYNQTTNYTIFNIKPRDASTLYKKFIATKKNLEQENIEINQEIQQRALRRAQRNATESFQHPNEIPQTPLFPNRNRPTTETPMDTPTPEVTSTPAPTQPINTETYEIELTKEFKKKHSRDFTEYQVEYGEGQVYKIYKNAEHFYLRTAKQNEKGKIISESFKQIVSIKPGYPDLKKDPKLCKVDIQILDKSGKTISLAIEKCKITDIAPLYREVIEGSQNGIINLANSTTLQDAQNMLEILEIVNYNSIGVNNNKKIADAVRIQRNIQESKKNQANNQTAKPVAVDTNITINASQGDTTPPSHSQEEFKIENKQGEFLKVYKKDDHFYIETAEKNEAGEIISKILSQIISIKPELPDVKDPKHCQATIQILDKYNEPCSFELGICKISSIAPLYRAVIDGSKKGIITLDEKIEDAEAKLKEYETIKTVEPDKNINNSATNVNDSTQDKTNTGDIKEFQLKNIGGRVYHIVKNDEHFYLKTLETDQKGVFRENLEEISSIKIKNAQLGNSSQCDVKLYYLKANKTPTQLVIYNYPKSEIIPLYHEIIEGSKKGIITLDEKNLQEAEEILKKYGYVPPTQTDVLRNAQQTNGQVAEPDAVDKHLTSTSSQSDSTTPTQGLNSNEITMFHIEFNQNGETKLLKVYKKAEHFYISTLKTNEKGELILRDVRQIISIDFDQTDVEDIQLCNAEIQVRNKDGETNNINLYDCKIAEVEPLYQEIINNSNLDENLQDTEEKILEYERNRNANTANTQTNRNSQVLQGNAQPTQTVEADKKTNNPATNVTPSTQAKTDTGDIKEFNIEDKSGKVYNIVQKGEHFYLKSLKTNKKGEVISESLKEIVSITTQPSSENIKKCDVNIRYIRDNGKQHLLSINNCQKLVVAPLYREVIDCSKKGIISLNESLEKAENKLEIYDVINKNSDHTDIEILNAVRATVGIQRMRKSETSITSHTSVKSEKQTSLEFDKFVHNNILTKGNTATISATPTVPLNNTTTTQTAPTRDAEKPIEPAEITTEPTDAVEPPKIVAPDEKLAKAEKISTDTPEPLTQLEIMEHYKNELEPAEQPKNFFVEPTVEPEEVKKFNFWKDFLKSPTENFLKCGGTALIIFGLFGVFTPFGAALACVAGLLCLCFSGDILKLAEKVIGGIANKIKGFFKHRKQLKDFDKFMEQAEEANPNTTFTKSQEKEMKKNPIERARLKQNKRRQKQLMKTTENDLVGATDGKLPNFFPIKGYKDKVGKHGSEMIELSTEKRRNNSDTIQGYLSQSDKINGPSRSLGRRRVLAADLDKQQEDLKNASISTRPVRKDSAGTPTSSSSKNTEKTL